jgi:hypothetical protein
MGPKTDLDTEVRGKILLHLPGIEHLSAGRLLRPVYLMNFVSMNSKRGKNKQIKLELFYTGCRPNMRSRRETKIGLPMQSG